MRVRYGNYRLGLAASDISISSEQIPNALGRPVAAEVVWAIRTRIKNPTGNPKAFPPILRAFEQAFSVHGRDLTLQFADGTPTHHILRSRDCIGGVRVTRFPTYETGARGQYVNYRDVTLEFRGQVPLSANQYISFSETISIQGGGARFGCKEVNFGPGVRQRLRTNTTCLATQSGSAVGYLVLPPVPPPIWPGALVDQFPDFDQTNPSTNGSGLNAFQANYPISWSYNYQWIHRLSGTPHFLRG